MNAADILHCVVSGGGDNELSVEMNAADILILVLVGVVLLLALLYLWRRRRRRRNRSCHSSCAGCPLADSCSSRSDGSGSIPD